MKKSQQLVHQSLLYSDRDTEITLDEIIDHSPRPEKQRNVNGPITTELRYDSSMASYFIQNPIDEKEQIAVLKSTVDINEYDVGKNVLVVFEENDVYRPVLTGIVKTLKAPRVVADKTSDNSRKIESNIDDSERLVFSASREIVLQCGKSSIHLTKAGKVIIRGSYVLSRSSGLNSIKGGSVSIN